MKAQLRTKLHDFSCPYLGSHWSKQALGCYQWEYTSHGIRLGLPSTALSQHLTLACTKKITILTLSLHINTAFFFKPFLWPQQIYHLTNPKSLHLFLSAQRNFSAIWHKALTVSTAVPHCCAQGSTNQPTVCADTAPELHSRVGHSYLCRNSFTAAQLHSAP